MRHTVIIGAAQHMDEVKSDSIALVVTSPPYPMIDMWDELFSSQNSQIKSALKNNDGALAFELMHKELDDVWSEVHRVLMPGGFACINIGDATRTIGKKFALYPNHARIISAFLKLGFSPLPSIIWRKQTNAPTKFTGSGMLPAGAYVTLENEWILIFRKGSKRTFTTEHEKKKRKESSFFWEERNVWFSDVWDIKGVAQKVTAANTRQRSAAYPFEVPYRLINMFSVKGDTVLDPFLGTGTTTLAAIAAERRSIGYEVDETFLSVIKEKVSNASINRLNDLIAARLERHYAFVQKRAGDVSKAAMKYFNMNINSPIMTSQEKELSVSFVDAIVTKNNNQFISTYKRKITVIPQ